MFGLIPLKELLPLPSNGKLVYIILYGIRMVLLHFPNLFQLPAPSLVVFGRECRGLFLLKPPDAHISVSKVKVVDRKETAGSCGWARAVCRDWALGDGEWTTAWKYEWQAGKC